MVGFLLFALAGFVFGYAAPKAWAFLPILIPLLVGVYTGFRDKWDTGLVILIVAGIAVTIAGVLLGRLLLYRLEGRQATA
jgi:hypothetical protein